MERYFPQSFAKYSAQNKSRKRPTAKTKPAQQEIISQDALVDACKTAIIILELEKIRDRYMQAEWSQRNEILGELYVYVEHNTIGVSKAVIFLLSSISNMTRSGMTYDNASSINFAVLNFYPYASDESQKVEAREIGRQCVFIGFNIAYDAFIHLRNLRLSMPGLAIIKFVYRMAKDRKDKELMDIVHQQYQRMEHTLLRPERTDLDNAKQMIQVFKNDLEDWDISYPILPAALERAVNEGRKKTK